VIDIISIVIIIGACTFVAAPLFKKQEEIAVRGGSIDSRVSELLNQQAMAASTIEDLEFDLQTGKLSQEDYESLVADQQKIQKEADARLKDISGVSSAELVEKLEKEITAEKEKLTSDSTPKCPSCKKEIKAGDRFCSECGAKLE